MLKRHSQILMIVLFALDMAITMLAWISAYFLRFDVQFVEMTHSAHAPLAEYLHLLPLALPVCAVVYHYCRLYVPRRESTFGNELLEVGKANLVLFFLVVTLANLYAPTVYSRVFFATFVAVNFVLVSLERTTARALLRWARSRGWNVRYALVVGAGKAAQNLVETLARNTWTAIHPIGYLDSNSARVGRAIDGVEILGSYDDVAEIARDRKVDQVFFALPYRDLLRLEDLVEKVGPEMMDIRIVPDFFSFRTLHSNFGEIDGVPVLSLQESPLVGINMLMKRVTDVAVGLFALAAFAVPMTAIALLIKRTSPGPVFYRQKRMGLDGRVFDMLKFRTMAVDAEKSTGAVWAVPDDPRRTRLGAFLRNTSLDELPQFFNVLRGEMSIVGPRPERPIFIEQFREQIPNYMLRHRMKAGITGWAQINGWRGNTSLRKRIQYDLYYIENWSIWLDLKIMLLTVFRGFVHKNAY